MASSGNKYGGTGTPTGAGALSAARAITQSAAGVPAHSAPKNALYRNETTGTLYINTDGATTWVAVGSGSSTPVIGPPGQDGRDGEDGEPGLPGRDGAIGAAGPAGASVMGPPGFDGADAEDSGLWFPPSGITPEELLLLSGINLNRIYSQICVQPASASRISMGMPTGAAPNGTISSGDDADGPWLLCTSVATTNSETGIWTTTIYQRRWGFITWGCFKTPSAFAQIMLNIGLYSTSLGTTAVAPGHNAYLRYSTRDDGTAFWRCITNDNGTGTVATTTVPVTASTVYRWAIKFVPGAVEFYMAIGDAAMALVATITTTLPNDSTLLVHYARALTLENVAKTLRWRNFSILI